MNTALPQAWRDWIKDNLQRGCTPDSMAQLMHQDGGFSMAVAQTAIARIAHSLPNPAGEAGQPKLIARPDIDTRQNRLQLPGCSVNIQMSLDQPRVVLLGNLLSDQECAQLCAYTQDRLSPSPVIDAVEGTHALHAHRSSRGAMLSRGESTLIAAIETRLAALTNWPIDHGEGMQVLRYETGHEYRPHFDWFDAEQAGPRKHLEKGGQRLASIVIYLNDVEQGGGTSFPTIGLQTQPSKGSAVFFCNTDPFGVPDKLSLHAGMPVLSGVKMIATKWLRERRY